MAAAYAILADATADVRAISEHAVGDGPDIQQPAWRTVDPGPPGIGTYSGTDATTSHAASRRETTNRAAAAFRDSPPSPFVRIIYGRPSCGRHASVRPRSWFQRGPPVAIAASGSPPAGTPDLLAAASHLCNWKIGATGKACRIHCPRALQALPVVPRCPFQVAIYLYGKLASRCMGAGCGSCSWSVDVPLDGEGVIGRVGGKGQCEQRGGYGQGCQLVG